MPFVLIRRCQFQESSDVTQSSYNTTIECNITSEGAFIAKYDKNITTEIGSKFISHGSLYCRLRPFTKGNAQLSQK